MERPGSPIRHPYSPIRRPRSSVGTTARGWSGGFSVFGGAIAEFSNPDRRRLYLGSAVVNSKWQNAKENLLAVSYST